MKVTLTAEEIHQISQIIVKIIYRRVQNDDREKLMTEKQYTAIKNLLDDGMHDSVNSIIAEIGERMGGLDFPLRWDRYA